MTWEPKPYPHEGCLKVPVRVPTGDGLGFRAPLKEPLKGTFAKGVDRPKGRIYKPMTQALGLRV